eukprot:gene3855-15709_t
MVFKVMVLSGLIVACATATGVAQHPSSSILDIIPPLPVLMELKTIVDISTGPLLVPVFRDGLKMLCIYGAKAIVPVPGVDTAAAVAAYPLCSTLAENVFQNVGELEVGAEGEKSETAGAVSGTDQMLSAAAASVPGDALSFGCLWAHAHVGQFMAASVGQVMLATGMPSAVTAAVSAMLLVGVPASHYAVCSRYGAAFADSVGIATAGAVGTAPTNVGNAEGGSGDAAREDTALLHIWAGLVTIFILLFIAAEYDPVDSDGASTVSTTEESKVGINPNAAGDASRGDAASNVTADNDSIPHKHPSRPGPMHYDSNGADADARGRGRTATRGRTMSGSGGSSSSLASPVRPDTPHITITGTSDVRPEGDLLYSGSGSGGGGGSGNAAETTTNVESRSYRASFGKRGTRGRSFKRPASHNPGEGGGGGVGANTMSKPNNLSVRSTSAGDASRDATQFIFAGSRSSTHASKSSSGLVRSVSEYSVNRGTHRSTPGGTGGTGGMTMKASSNTFKRLGSSRHDGNTSVASLSSSRTVRL